MAIGDQGLTGVTKEQAMTAPGMAYFAGTGPAGKYCKDCRFKGYAYDGATMKRKNGEEYTVSHRSNGCAKAYEMRGKPRKPTPDIADGLHACKYFQQNQNLYDRYAAPHHSR